MMQTGKRNIGLGAWARSLAALALLVLACGARAQHVAHSVLATGRWWKLDIGQTGIYRLATSDLASLAGQRVADIALYGHPGGTLDPTNGNPRPDDLEEMAIDIHDLNGNGTFDEGDYILFYASGPDRWYYSEGLGRHLHERHPYAATNSVYLTIAGGAHKRIGLSDELTPSGETITSCRVAAVYERDLTNTHESGQIWVGEKFYGGTNQHSVSVALPGVASGNVKVSYGLASVSGAAAQFRVSCNGAARTHTIAGDNPYRIFFEEFAGGSNSTLTFSFTYTPGENLAAGYLDYVEADAATALAMHGTEMDFYIPAAEGTHSHRMTNAAGVTVWDVSDYNAVQAMRSTVSGNTLTFNAQTDSERHYVAFTGSDFAAPAAITPLPNQDLHGAPNPDMVIVCLANCRAQAQRLAALHSIHDNLEVLVATQEEVFNEYASGRKDPLAVRELMRTYWLRAQADSSLRTPRYLLLFGKGTYDNRDLLGNGTATLVTYQSPTSFDDDGASYASDDLFGFLHDGESGIGYESLDLSIGRLPAQDSSEAAHLVNKIENYLNRSDMMVEGIRGDWRNSVALLADDADPSCAGDTTFTWSQEVTARQIGTLYPQYNIDKIYADAYIQQSGADGSFYPDVNNALKKRLDYGCMLLNYIGHGSAQYIGTERYMQRGDIDNYRNFNQLPFFITSTCTFGRYDMVGGECGAEAFVLAKGAGIGCLAASRPISHVQTVNTEMVMQALNPANAIGDAVRIAKNRHGTAPAITLIGDPALRLSFPKYRVVVTAINGHGVVPGQADSALVLSTVTVEGEIRDANGQLVSDFDGVIYPQVYDRVVAAHTLANDNEGCEVFFTQQKNLLYKGRDSVQGGRFSYHFVVPRDVAYKFERGKLSHYAKSATEDASGAYTDLLFGGFDETVDLRETRPAIRLFINDTNFRDGGMTDENPTLLAMLYDSVGINAVGSGLGHDITAIVDGNANDLTVLNDFYETDIDDEHRGTVRYTFSGLSRGWHSITFKAWNIYNYSGSETIHFCVHGSDTAASAAFVAYPNPASSEVWMRVEHNVEVANAVIDIYDRMGRRVRTLSPTAAESSYVVGPVRWDLRSDSGATVARGIYLTRCTLTTADGQTLVERGKIVVK